MSLEKDINKTGLCASLKKLHSAEYFGEQRDYWWNLDFLQLMEKRWDLKNVQSVLDVGCGVGHWGRLLSKILPDTANVIGIDKESGWIEEAKKRAMLDDLGSRYTYQESDAHAMPFPDESFDMVTCQTVLIHVADVQQVLSEMVRVLKRDGILIVIEPNNIGRSLTLSTLDMDTPIDEILDIVRFCLACERGKYELNEGYISLGDQLPGYLSDMDLKDIQVYISDKARPFFPPYDSKEQQIVIEERKEWTQNNFWIWDEEQTQKYYEAGGGDPEHFKVYWLKALNRQNKSFLEGIKANKYSTAGGKLNYCISARKL